LLLNVKDVGPYGLISIAYTAYTIRKTASVVKNASKPDLIGPESGRIGTAVVDSGAY